MSLEITIEKDTFINPVRDYDNFTNFALSVNSYAIGDDNFIGDLQNLIRNAPNYSEHLKNEYNFAYLPDLETVGDLLGVFAVKIEVFGYLHGDLALSLSRTGQFADRFDSGKAGFLYVSKQDIRDNYGIKRVTQKYIEKARELMLADFQTLTHYLSGECYYLKLYKNGQEDNYCGFFGNDIETNGLLDYIDPKNHTTLKEQFETFIQSGANSTTFSLNS